VSDGTPGTAAAGGLRHALARAGTSLVILVRTRLELASVEFLEARERTVSQLVLTVVAVTFISFAVLMASALVVVLFWDTHRTAALAVVTLLHGAIGAVAVLRLKANSRSAPSPFAATLAELERDGQWLSGETHDRTSP
jgi:uncharacterized membrane protein YqjE